MYPSVLPKIIFGFLVALGLQLAVSVLAYVNVTRLAESARMREQSYRTLDALGDLLKQLLDAETGQRGFLLTGREEYLQPYRQSLPALPRELDRLRGLVAGRPDLHRQLHELEPVVAAKLAELRATIILRRDRGLADATGDGQMARGKLLMDDLRARIARMESGERKTLEARERDTAEGARLALQVAAAAGVLAVLSVGLSLWLLTREIRQRDQVKRALRQLNAELEDRVRARTADLAEANRELSQRSQENEAFVYSVSHDLRSPLVNLEGFGRELGLAAREARELLAEPDVPDALRRQLLALLDGDMAESLRFIRTAVRRLSDIIDALLRLSRVGRVEYRWQQVDVRALVERVVEALHGLIAERGAAVTLGALPPAWGDPTALEQVFANLIGNALNYLAPGRPGRVEVGCLPPAAGAGGGLRTYYVKDNGRGIPEAYRAKVFQLFQRLHPEAAPGEGMGLTIVRRIVERHGGRVRFESAADAGTTFFVDLPTGPG